MTSGSGLGPIALLVHADRALYRAKAQDRNRTEVAMTSGDT